MNKVFYLLLIPVLLASCDKIELDGVEETRSYSLSPFSSVAVSDGISFIVSDTATTVTVTADRGVFSELRVLVKAGTLHVFRAKWLMPTMNYKATIVIPLNNLEEVELSGGSDFYAEVPYQVETFSLDMSGGSVCRIPVTCSTAIINLSGGSKVQTADTGEGLVCNRLEGNLSGGSILTCTCDETIKCKLSGGSILNYSGSADTSPSSLSGGSKIVHMAE